jgi:hypothetical protein
VEESGKSDIVRFFSHGKAFKIHERELFVDEILPVFFPQQTKFESFLRQLALYGFKRLISGIDQGGYWVRGLCSSRRPAAFGDNGRIHGAYTNLSLL